MIKPIFLLSGATALLTASFSIAAPESSSKEEAATSEASAVDPSLSQAGTATSVRARLTSAMRRAAPGSLCNGVDVLCAGAHGSVVVLPGAIVNGDLINAPSTQPCLSKDPRCKTRKP